MCLSRSPAITGLVGHDKETRLEAPQKCFELNPLKYLAILITV